MKKRFTGMFVVLCLCAVPGAGKAQVNHIRIMPEGDSVTARGGSPESSYRYWLYTRLQNAGFNNFEFVGNQNGVSDGAPFNPNFDQHYEGGGPGGDAWTTQNGIDNISDVNSRTPDIVLLDLGSNDYNPDQDAKTNVGEVQANLETIIQGLAAQNPDIIVLLAKPTPWVAVDKHTRQFMDKLGSAASKAAKVEKKAGVHVETVNLFGGFNARKDTKDTIHPNVLGEQKIAKKYFNALKKILKKK
jgi:acyl-CoA thioesterase-1